LIHAKHDTGVGADKSLQRVHIGVRTDRQRDGLDPGSIEPCTQTVEWRLVDEAVRDEHQHASRRAGAF